MHWTKLDLKSRGHSIKCLAIVAGRIEHVQYVTSLDLVEIWESCEKLDEIASGERRRVM